MSRFLTFLTITSTLRAKRVSFNVRSVLTALICISRCSLRISTWWSSISWSNFFCCFFNSDDYIDTTEEKNQGKDAQADNYLFLH